MPEPVVRDRTRGEQAAEEYLRVYNKVYNTTNSSSGQVHRAVQYIMDVVARFSGNGECEECNCEEKSRVEAPPIRLYPREQREEDE